MTHPGRVLGLVLVASLVLPACTNPGRPSIQADTVALPTPLQTLTASLARVVAQLEGAVAAAGSRLTSAPRPYRPSEPQSLLQVPRVVLRADLADADDGFVVVYQLLDEAAAKAQGRSLADHLASGFGQTNFSPDTQFSVRQVADTVVFTSWSRGRSSDPTQAEKLFDAVSSVGEEIEVRK